MNMGDLGVMIADILNWLIDEERPWVVAWRDIKRVRALRRKARS